MRRQDRGRRIAKNEAGSMTALASISKANGVRWYLVRTIRHREIEASEAIGALELETYLPHEIHFARRGRRLIRVRAPLFRQYLFARFDLERDAWQQLRRVHWVDGIVSANERPLRVPDWEIDALRRGEQVGAFDQTVLPRGCRVRVLTGPFAGMIGEVSRATPRRRVEILFAILGQTAFVKIDRLHLAKI
jgi:transcriptional antiterminator RfaH